MNFKWKNMWNRKRVATTASIADEVLFRRLILLERRRSERTGIPFALMLLELDALSEAASAASAVSAVSVDELCSAIATGMRETDITGWQCHGSTLGVILTTLNDADWQTVQSAVMARVERILSSYLEPAQLQLVRISIHLFPEAGDGTAAGAARHFYSESEKKDLKGKQAAILKRAIDILGSLAALVVLAPLFFVIAVLIKSTSDGPVFFRQKRMGQFGEEFVFLKFRSMFVNNDSAIHREYMRNLIDNKVSAASGPFKITNDPRVTPIGRFLRKTSLDELPQFINVLTGEMSLVGPRPPIRYEFENYSLWHRRRILEGKPGITGVWQVNGRSRTTFDEMVRMDLRYIHNQSVWLDLKILLKTPLAMIGGSGAY